MSGFTNHTYYHHILFMKRVLTIGKLKRPIKVCLSLFKPPHFTFFQMCIFSRCAHLSYLLLLPFCILFCILLHSNRLSEQSRHITEIIYDLFSLMPLFNIYFFILYHLVWLHENINTGLATIKKCFTNCTFISGKEETSKRLSAINLIVRDYEIYCLTVAFDLSFLNALAIL